MGINLPYGKDKTVIVDVPDKSISFTIDRGAALPLERKLKTKSEDLYVTKS